ncbi:MAG: L,D-transpeptidase [Methylococcaceae bacterium]|jgi:hypothetical protein
MHKNSVSRLSQSLALGCLLFFNAMNALAVNGGAEGPWEGFPRTRPTPRYENDPGANAQYHFGVTKAFSPYVDPDKSVAMGLPDPLDDPDFASYNLIVVISKAESDFWGPEQTLRVYKRGVGLLYYWLVSTGMRGHETASGYFTPKEFSSRHWSQEYDAPMLWAVFFHGGMALHSSLDSQSIADMGKAAESHGCVHEEDYRAEEMFHLIGQSGYGPVDQISEASGRKTGKTVSAYKTLIIIGPTTTWDSTPTQAQTQTQGVTSTIKWVPESDAPTETVMDNP